MKSSRPSKIIIFAARRANVDSTSTVRECTSGAPHNISAITEAKNNGKKGRLGGFKW